ncbi:DEAD/DEAH box helicase [Marinobacter sp. 1Y8]
MSDRKYLKYRIADLEKVFADSVGDFAVLEDLEEELNNRSTQRARILLEKIEEKLFSKKSMLGGDLKEALPSDDSGQVDNFGARSLNDSEIFSNEIDWGQVAGRYTLRGSEDAQYDSDAPITNQPGDILDVWTVLEALSPQSYKRPYDLVVGDGSVAWLQDGQEPWLRGEKSRPKKNLYYLVYLGAIDVEGAVQKLMDVFQDDRVERPSVNGLAALGVVLLDKKGIPVPDTGLSISSFGWAYGRTLQGKLGELKAWGLAEEVLIEGLEKIIYRLDAGGRPLPFSFQVAKDAFRWIVKNCGIPSEDAREPTFAIRRYQPFSKGDPEPPLLNSFFLDDIQQAKSFVENESTSRSLSQYLGLEAPCERYDLLAEPEQLESALQPRYTPLARWPGKGRYPLVLLQQAAINLCYRELGAGGLFSVNGPPGTGKTTLLRDVVASVQADRAKALSKFDDANDAFKHAGKMKLGSTFVHLYELHESLKGHELLVASSNNKAVENISRELPLRTQVAEDIDGLEYFKVVSDALVHDKSDSWGLIAAVLGNSTNRSAYINKAWWDTSSGLRNYFLSLSGQNVSSVDEDGNETWPQIITESDLPLSDQEAKQRWQVARREFSKALSASEEAIQKAQTAYECYIKSHKLRTKLEQVSVLKVDRNEQLTTVQHSMRITEAELTDLLVKLGSACKAEASFLSDKPNLFIRIFARAKWARWKAGYNELLNHTRGLKEHESQLKEAINEFEREQSGIHRDLQELRRQAELLQDQVSSALRQLDDFSDVCGDKLVTDELWSLSHDERQTFAPNFTSKVHELRDEVFVAAIKLQKAFIDAAAKPMRQNLGVFFFLLSGGSLKRELQHLLPDIWSTGFLLTPVLSTTFASVGRMLKGMPKESIGWLLIDEAGQATPQAAVGAISRAKRVISVGDPLQIEPVVNLPPLLVDSISSYFGVDPYKWMAPYASVQTLSDEANAYGTKLQRDLSEIWIGSPLLVHRRCDNPMFSISNRMAYNGLMVHATPKSDSYLSDLFECSSAWFDVKGTAQEKWCPEEGEHVCRMILAACKKANGDPDLFVITPFRRVAEKMRQRMKEDAELLEEFGISDAEGWIKNSIGTVHTFQGKEAQGVILLLGAPSPTQSGARNWATSNVNLLNVAISRAKQNFYVVGNRDLWGGVGHMKVLSQRICLYAKGVSKD